MRRKIKATKRENTGKVMYCSQCCKAVEPTKVNEAAEEFYCPNCKAWVFGGSLFDGGCGGGSMKHDDATEHNKRIYDGKSDFEYQ